MNETKLHFDVVIVGLGKTGLSCVRYFSQQGLRIAVTDSRDVPPELSALHEEIDSVSVYVGEINTDVLLAADQIILSPGVSLEHESIKKAIARGIPVCGDIEIFCQQVNAPVIAITGSNGKSTVTTLVAEMLQQAGLKTSVGGNLGTPALDLLVEPPAEIYVLELSSFQLETTFSLNAHASVVLNISPDHMDRYNTLDDYINAKKKIYSGQGVMVINKDDQFVEKMLDETRNSISFSLSKPSDNNFGVINEDDDIYLCQGEDKIINQNELLIKGQHNIANVLAAMALASSMNVPVTAMVETLKRFKGLEHRCQFVKTINSVSWYNDSKATNVGACIASIEGLFEFGEIILIAGGDSKGADLSSLTSVIKQHVKKVILLGIDANKLAETFGSEVAYEFVNSMDEAVDQAYKVSESGNIVLLAPACASLDMYDNYQQRGDIFISAVNALEAI
ncbi:MAG: UDP-N-acetylmuramoyl-L-alanine--D-glutamate ligase [Pseudomonadota bacterium]